MKKTKLILTSLILALMLTFSAGFSAKVYASDDDPQGTSGSSKTQPAPQQAPSDSTLASVFRALSSFFFPW